MGCFRKFFQAVVILGLAVLGQASSAIDIINENPHLACQKLDLYRELSVYKDPTLFLSDLQLITADPGRGWKQLLSENPLLTRLHGAVQLMQLGPARPFKSFGAISKVYRAADPRVDWGDDVSMGEEPKSHPPLVVPIEICGTDAYNSTLGFVVESQLKDAQKYDPRSSALPPSVYPNPIPVLKD
jgi:hypothetical protein